MQHGLVFRTQSTAIQETIIIRYSVDCYLRINLVRAMFDVKFTAPPPEGLRMSIV